VNHDQAFRIVLIAGILVVLPIGMYHRIRSQATGESLDRRQEGLFILATLRPVGLVLWLGLFAYMVDPSWMAWSSIRLPGWLRWTGVVVCALASALLLWTFHVLGPNLTDTVVTRKAHTLVSRGPYRFVRHPFYDCAFLLALGGALLTANWFLFAAGGVFFVLCVIRTRTEERNLLARFGGAYRTYMERTGRFWPRMRANP
jgi:protein-S-isoprenylcysteine O-methyltransferase Ste14